MKLRNLGVASTAALGLLVAPIATQAIAAERAAAPATAQNEMGGNATALAVIFGLAALVVFVLATDQNDEPVSA